MKFKNIIVFFSPLFSMIVVIHCACTIAEPLLKTTEIKFGAAASTLNYPTWSGCTCCFRSGSLFWTILKCTNNYYINSKTCPTNTLSCQWCGGSTYTGTDLTQSSCCVVDGLKVTCTNWS
jgi:hypothetical protein